MMGSEHGRGGAGERRGRGDSAGAGLPTEAERVSPPLPRSSAPLRRLALALILGVYLALAVGYGIVTPLFETPDEHLHYLTAEYIAREGRLPAALSPGAMGQEAAQPPLYYALASLVVRAVDGGAEGRLWNNPRVTPGYFDRAVVAWPPVNANMFVHGPAEAWPWEGYALAAHLLRLLSTVMGLGTLLCIHAAGRVVWPHAPERALLATALVAFLPQFAFIHAAVSNDAAITLFASATIWQLLRLTTDRRPQTAAGRRPAYILLGATIGLAMLSKAAGILLLVYAVGVLGLRAFLAGDGRRWTRAVEATLLVAGPALLLAGWLLWRNWTLYGDVTATTPFVELTSGHRPYTLRQVWGDLDRVWLSLFAVFGWMTVSAPAWVYAVWSGIAGAAVVGAALSPAPLPPRSPAPPRSLFHPAIILLGWFALVTAGWLQFMLRTPADQGRLFFPALVPLALGAAFGLSRWPRPARWAAVALALATSVYCLVAVLPAAYAFPPVVETIPAEATPLDVSFPEGLVLLGATVDTPVARPGEWVWVTLYWRAGPDGDSDAPQAHLELFGRGFERIGAQAGYHGRGQYPATLWPPGAIVADRMAVRVAAEAIGPVEAQLRVTLDEEAQGVDIGRVKIIPAEWPEPVAPLATLGEAIELAGAELSATTVAAGETVELRLRWQVIASPGPALLHMFVHLGDPAQPPLAQSDAPVMGGEYPSWLWETGEVFEETVSLVLPPDLPPGEYPIQIGVYDFDSGARLPVGVEGRRPTDTYPVGRLTVE